LLSNNGILPQDANRSCGPVTLSRSRIVKESLILTVVTWLLGLWATFWFDVGGPFEVIARVAATIFFILGMIGLGRFVYAFLLLKDSPESKETIAQEKLFSQGKTPIALPQQQQFPAGDWQRRENTKEIVSRPSVTEVQPVCLKTTSDSANAPSATLTTSASGSEPVDGCRYLDGSYQISCFAVPLAEPKASLLRPSLSPDLCQT
jgi:hypothetical protein